MGWCRVPRPIFFWRHSNSDALRTQQNVRSWPDEQPKGTAGQRRHRGEGDKERFVKNAAWLEPSTRKVRQPELDMIAFTRKRRRFL